MALYPSWRPFRSRLLFSHLQTLFDLHCVLWYVYIKMMIHRGNGPLASRLRQRKFQLLRRFSIPADALPGSLSLSHLRCGKPSCHCADDRGHPVWSLTFMVQGKKQVQHVPRIGSKRCGARQGGTGTSRRRARSVSGQCTTARTGAQET